MHVPIQLIYKAQGNPFRLGRDEAQGNSQTQYVFKWSKLCLEGDGHVIFWLLCNDLERSRSSPLQSGLLKKNGTIRTEFIST